MATAGMVDEELFLKASERMRANTRLNLTNEQKLELYGYYKQATEGKCCTAKPSFFDFTGRAKWEAWTKLGNLDKNQSMKLYVELVNKIDPNWENSPLVGGDKEPIKGSSSSGGGPVVSTLAAKAEVIPENQKTLFDWCKEGQLDGIKRCIQNGEDINKRDEEGMSVLHWSCDRGNTDVIEFLISSGADTAAQDAEGQTPLHYASFCGHAGAISILLANGADKNKVDNSGETAFSVADPSVKHLIS